MSDEHSPLVLGGRNNNGTTHMRWGRCNASIMHPTLLQHTLPFLSPTAICAASQVYTGLANMTRSDSVWTNVLRRDWSADGEEKAELQRRVRREARARRGGMGLDGDAFHSSITMHTDVPVLSAHALDGPLMPSAPQSPAHFALAPFSPVALVPSPQQRRNDSGIPRARSIATLNTLTIGLSHSAISSGNSSVGRSGNSLASSPQAGNNSSIGFHSTLGKLSPDNESGEDSASPSKRAQGDALSALSAPLPFSFPVSAAAASAASAVAAAFSPVPLARAELLASQRWLAPPDSIKSIYADVVHTSYRRFHADVAPLLTTADRLPRFVKVVANFLAGVAMLCFITIHMFIEDDTEVPMGMTGDEPTSTVPLHLQPKFLAIVFTGSMSLLVCLLTANVCRTLSRSLQARRKLWQSPPPLASDASESEIAAAASFLAFQSADKSWWRHHSTNSWYSIRYLVWSAPKLRWVLLLLAGIGCFIGLWMVDTMLFGPLSPAMGVGLGMLWPGLSVLLTFQIGRMLQIS